MIFGKIAQFWRKKNSAVFSQTGKVYPLNLDFWIFLLLFGNVSDQLGIFFNQLGKNLVYTGNQIQFSYRKKALHLIVQKMMNDHLSEQYVL